MYFWWSRAGISGKINKIFKRALFHKTLLQMGNYKLWAKQRLRGLAAHWTGSAGLVFWIDLAQSVPGEESLWIIQQEIDEEPPWWSDRAVPFTNREESEKIQLISAPPPLFLFREETMCYSLYPWNDNLNLMHSCYSSNILFKICAFAINLHTRYGNILTCYEKSKRNNLL